MAAGWIGVDLDGTLVSDADWQGPEHVPDPIPAMALRVKRLLDVGQDVRLYTACANSPEALPMLRQWCRKHFGRELPITARKDYQMLVAFDDRALQVIPNSGLLLQDLLLELHQAAQDNLNVTAPYKGSKLHARIADAVAHLHG